MATFQYRPVTIERLPDALRAAPAGSRSIRGIVLHHTSEPNQARAAQLGNERTVRAIWNGHVEANGWRDIGYHFVVLPDGTTAFCRPLSDQGAHASEWNPKTIGIAMIGDFDGSERPTQEQQEAVGVILAVLGQRFNFDLDADYRPGGEGLAFHREEPKAIHDGKTCPGVHVSKAQVRGWMSGTAPEPEAEEAPAEAADVAPWADAAVAYCREHGLMAGYPDGTFGGTRAVTRQELAVVAERLHRARGTTQPP